MVYVARHVQLMAGTNETYVAFAYREKAKDFDAGEIVDKTIAKMGLGVE